VEERGIDPGHEVFQVFTDTFEFEICESGKDSACQWRRMSVFRVRARLGRLEFEDKSFELCQRGEAGDDLLG